MSQLEDRPRPRRPLPVPTALTEPFWDAARQGRLALQCCTNCDRFRHPPVPLCPYCHSSAFEYREVSGAGTVYEYSVMRQPRVAGLEVLVPFACLVVEIDEQPGLLVVGNLVDAPADQARVGMRVQVRFEDIGEDGLRLPQFAPHDEKG